MLTIWKLYLEDWHLNNLMSYKHLLTARLVLVMQSQSRLSENALQEGIKQFAFSNWEKLNDRQKKYAKKVWAVITYKWRWQIAMNIPYLALFLLDRSIPAVHQFDMALLATITSKLSVPAFVSLWMGF